MTIRIRVRPSVVCLLLLCWLPTPGAISHAADRPNIVFIFSDDHAPHAIGAYGGIYDALDPTPNIDALARQGMLFRNSFCTNSICGPSRAVIQTGKHSHKNGFMNNGNNFDASQQTFPKLLQQAGYQTAIFGKWHLKSLPQGFDDWKVLPGQGEYYNPMMIGPDGRQRYEGYCTDVVTQFALDWMEEGRDKDKPFLLMCQHKAPHRNWMPPTRYLTLYDDVDIPEPETLFDDYSDNAPGARFQEMEIDRHMHMVFDLFADPPAGFDPEGEGRFDRSAWRNYDVMTEQQKSAWDAAYGPKNAELTKANLSGNDLVRWKYQRYMKNYLRCIKTVDDSVGQLMEYLEQAGLSDNTVVIYSSDQGFYLGDHGWYDKRWMYEESLKMPFVAKWPGVTEAGSTNENLIQNLDYAETFLDMAGAEIPPDMQGRSLVPLLKGETPEDWRTSIYYHYYEYPSVHMVPRHNGVRTERYKLMHFYQFDEWEFYDLAADPDELTNRYNDPTYADRVADLKQQLNHLIEFYDDNSDRKVMPDPWQAKYRTQE